MNSLIKFIKIKVLTLIITRLKNSISDLLHFNHLNKNKKYIYYKYKYIFTLSIY